MPDPGYSVADGLLTIRSVHVVQLLDRIASQFETWARAAKAEWITPPPLIEVAKLKQIDYFINFPHLAGAITTLDTSGLDRRGYDVVGGQLPPTILEPARFVVPSSACHSLYFDLEGQQLSRPKIVFTYCACHRNETSYDGLRRLRIFTMYEIVSFGSAADVTAFLNVQRSATLAFAGRLGIDLRTEIGNDPFFDPNSAKGWPQKGTPTKEEFIAPDGTAIGSINYHRNFFGDRCNIRGADGSLLHTGCAAWGLERWLHVLLAMHGGDPETALAALERAGVPAPA